MTFKELINHPWWEKFYFWSCCCLFFFIPVAKSPAIIAGSVFLITWAAFVLRGKKKIILSGQTHLWALIALIILHWVGLLFAENTDYEIQFAWDTYYLLYPFAIASISFTDFKAETLIKAFLAGLTFTATLSIMQYAGIMPTRYYGLPLGLLSVFHHIILSLFLAFGLLLLSFYYKQAANRKETFLIAGLMLIFFIDLAVVVYGRTGYVAFMLLAPVIMYNMVGRKRLWIIIVLTALILGIFLSSSRVQDRLKSAAQEINQYSQGEFTSTGVRLDMWKMSAQIFIENPVFGAGASGFKSRWEKNLPYPDADHFNDPHNTFFFIAAGFGTAGLVVLIWIFAVLFQKGWQNRETPVGFSILSFSLIFFIGSLANSLIVGSLPLGWSSVFIGLLGALKE
jgi:O-antigen ligase